MMNASVIIIIIQAHGALLSVSNPVKANFRDASGSGIVSGRGGEGSRLRARLLSKATGFPRSTARDTRKIEGSRLKYTRYLFAPTLTEPRGYQVSRICIRETAKWKLTSLLRDRAS